MVSNDVLMAAAEAVHESRCRNTPLLDLHQPSGPPSAWDVRIAQAVAAVVTSDAREKERERIAANMEAEAEIAARQTWQAKDALRSFARRLREAGDPS